MNCPTIQQLLLMSDQPAQPAVEVRAHLAECAACRSLQRRLLAVEQQIPLLPVPASTRRDSFLQQVRQGNVLPEPTVSAAELWLTGYRPAKERGLLKLALSLALAASLLLFALGWWLWPHHDGRTLTADPLVVRQLDRNQRLAQARTPWERVEVLADLARGLHREAQQLAGKSNPEELRVVARFYREVVREDLVKEARAARQGPADAARRGRGPATGRERGATPGGPGGGRHRRLPARDRHRGPRK